MIFFRVNLYQIRFHAILEMSFTVGKAAGKLFFKDMGCFGNRNQGTIWCIQEADKLYNWPDFPRIKIYTEDFIDVPDAYQYCSKESFDNLVPDYTFKDWSNVGDYDEITKLISENGLLKPEQHKAGWIGNLHAHPNRHLLYTIGARNTKLCDIRSSFDFRNIAKSPFITMPDLVKKYAVLIDIEGFGYSGRVKHLLHSRRPLIIIEREQKEYYFEFLKPWIHYIPAKNDCSDILDKIKWALYHTDAATKIATNAYEFSQTHLTRKGCYAQWNKIISNVAKCNRETCGFARHPHIYNNGGTHCCFACKVSGTHGPACGSILLDKPAPHETPETIENFFIQNNSVPE
jgi:hypothetical protein